MSSDFLLIYRIRNGDRQADNQFVKKYYPSIYQYCFLHIHDKECTEDITQETVTKFFEVLMKNSDIGKIQSYLYSIFGNLLKNYYKKKKDLLTKQMPEISENRLIEIEIRLDIEQAVDRLPEEIKETAIFFFFQEIKQKEIVATVYKGNIIKNLIMDCQSYTKYRPNETTGGIFVSWRRKEELPTGA